MSSLKDFFVRIYNFIRYDIWKVAETELSKGRKIVYRFVKTIIIATKGYIDDKLGIRASALTYSLFFAVVPIIALVISVGKGFGMEKMIENALQKTFIAQADVIPTVMSFVKRYLETMQGGLFIGVGIVILLWSVTNFFRLIENTFNNIWQVKKSRSPIRQFTTYFSIILILPILIILSSGFSIFLNTTFSQISFLNFLSPLLNFGAKLLPYFLNWLIFTLMYLLIPNTQVKFVNALIAGVLAGTAFQIFQMLYIKGQINLSRYNAVYGGFAAIPLLLLWLRISCLILLLGAEISYAAQSIHDYEFDLDIQNISLRYKKFISLFITYVIIKQFEQQKPPLSAQQIASEYKLPIRLVHQTLNQLVNMSILIEVFSEKTKSKTYQPALDIHQVTVGMLYEKIETYGSDLFLSNKNKWLDAFWEKITVLQQENKENLSQVLVKDI